MFEALRATTFLGVLAAGIPALVSAQITTPPPPGQPSIPATNTSAPMGGGAVHPLRLDEKSRPITESGFVKSGPTVFMDESEKAGLTHWTHKMGTDRKSVV